MNHREVCIRCKAQIGSFFPFQIIPDPIPIRLFVQAQYQPHPSGWLESDVLQGFHGIIAGNHRSLVIGSSPPEYFSIDQLSPIRIPIPVLPFRHHIQVPQDSQDFSGKIRRSRLCGFMAAKFDMAPVIVHVSDQESVPGSPGKHSLIASMDFRAEGKVSFPGIFHRRSRHTGNTDQLLEGFYHFFPIFTE